MKEVIVKMTDVKDLVRCENCKWWADRICNRYEDKRIRFADDFCSYGERKTDE